MCDAADRMGEPQTKSVVSNKSHAGSGGHQDNTIMEEKAGRHAVEADNDPMLKTAVRFVNASLIGTITCVMGLDSSILRL